MELCIELALDFFPLESIPRLMMTSRTFAEITKKNIERLIPSPTSHKYRGKETLPDDIDITICNRVCSKLKKCAVCKDSFRGTFTRFGVYGHSSCIRQFLINTFYLVNRGIDEDCVLDNIPSETLFGFRPYYREQYDYDVVWEKKHPYLIHDKYTLEGLCQTNSSIIEQIRIHNEMLLKKKEEARVQKEKLLEKTRLKKEKEALLQERRIEKLNKRVDKLEQWRQKNNVTELRFLHTLINNMDTLYGDYLSDKILAPKTTFSVLKQRILFLHKLYQIDYTNVSYKYMKHLTELFLKSDQYDVNTYAELISLSHKIRNFDMYYDVWIKTCSLDNKKAVLLRIISFEEYFNDEEISRIFSIFIKPPIINWDKVKYIIDFPDKARLNQMAKHTLLQFVNTNTPCETISNTILQAPTPKQKGQPKKPYTQKPCESLTCANIGSPECKYKMCGACCPKKDCARHL